jgi:GNAT superfamily N-acetyltransferase
MDIRPGNIADVDRCERLDTSYATDYVWQMDETSSLDRITINFRRMRSPRRMEVIYPRGTQDLYADIQHHECFLVASELATIFGYLDMRVSHWQWQGWIEHVIVNKPHRRRGIATRLLQAAERWARQSQLSTITVPLQPKNDPAICFFLARGYAFSGFIDRYFNNGDMALLYALTL